MDVARFFTDRFKRILIICAALLFFLPVTGTAERSEKQGRFIKVNGLGKVDKLAPKERESDLRTLKEGEEPNLRFSAFVPGLGRTKIHFFEERSHDTYPTVTLPSGEIIKLEHATTLLKGTFNSRKGGGIATGALYERNGENYLLAYFVLEGGKGAGRAYRLRVDLASNKEARVTKGKNVPGTCSEVEHEHHSHEISLLEGAGLEIEGIGEESYQIELSIDADQEFVSKVGGSSQAQTVLSVLINDTEQFFREMNTSFSVVRQNLLLQTVGSSNYKEKLDSFSLLTTSSDYFGVADAYHLVTGDRMVNGAGIPGILGVAYIGTGCLNERFATGISTFNSAAQAPIIFAHELGHNFGLSHVNTQTIMNALLPFPYPTEFSDESKERFSNFASSAGCLDLEEENPTPTPTPTVAPTATVTPTPTPTATVTPTPTPTSSPTNTPTPTATPTPMPTNSPTPTVTPTPVPTSTPTSTPNPTVTPTSTPSPSPNPTVTPTSIPSPTPTPTVIPTNTPIPTESPTVTPTSSPPTGGDGNNGGGTDNPSDPGDSNNGTDNDTSDPTSPGDGTNGGGNGDGDNPTQLDLSLDSSVSLRSKRKKAIFKVRITIGKDDLDRGTTLMVYKSRRSDRLGRLLFKTTAESEVTQLVSKVRVGAKKKKRKKRKRKNRRFKRGSFITVMAVNEKGQATSEMKRIRPERVRTKRGKVRLSRWFRMIKRKIRVSTM